ncbi:sulfotransferase family 2 domain-containing protein [Mangrovimonas sp. AS39]|uniref:sulfotransferase family 2 domain-containing protein n=1 Tax=Mangrovimonas futianensis TaxID=2895523 RepID=UPI001E37B57C|nr:sulfotransferase family 2 domain-containing protein [Mangrovimonas futianensis]MCF1191239.1 sulfotransferase family 2 domain-containing protein [Mangrovimonas futianensis]MCF1194934.1 sulfotransferase family 2 domain-containing protein [Mangrovimonas futianensis]
MLISVHIPKTAGRSFRTLLKSKFNNSLVDDYSDGPLNHNEEQQHLMAEKFNKKYTLYYNLKYKLKNTQCIHGHFLPYKYNYHYGKKNHQFVTWLRDPIERMVSHYFYRKIIFENTVKTSQQKSHHKYNSFEEFCFSEKMRNPYHKFFYKFPIEQFDYIGIVEHFDEDYTFFAETFLNLKIDKVVKSNVTREKSVLPCLSDAEFLQRLKDFHNLDYHIYNKALNIRANR